MTATELHADRVHAVERTAPRRRGRSRLVLLGVLLAILGAVGAVLVVGQVSRRAPVVAVARPVAFGQTLQAQDLRSVLLPLDSELATVPWDRVGELVGRIATTDLLPGQTVTPDAVTLDGPPAPGSAVVGVAAEPGRLPATGLRPRDHVLVVDTTETAGAGTDAVVLHVEPGAGGGPAVVDLLVADLNAPNLARLSASGHAVLVLVSGR